MATLRDIKKRIGSVKNTQKITKAMKMVAAAKLRRAQMAVIGARPYAEKLNEVITDMANRSDSLSVNPFFTAKEPVKNVHIFIFTSNRGLCGGFNSNLLRRAEGFLKDLKAKSIHYKTTVFGKKGREYFKARGIHIDDSIIDLVDHMSFDNAQKLAQNIINSINNSETDEFYLIYNRFISALSQDAATQKVLPLAIKSEKNQYGVDYIYEPSRDEILNSIIPKYLANQIYRAHLESRASELGSRMSAMENATNNAKEMIGALTLKYNRARQAAITVELMDIVNGAEAIK